MLRLNLGTRVMYAATLGGFGAAIGGGLSSLLSIELIVEGSLVGGGVGFFIGFFWEAYFNRRKIITQGKARLYLMGKLPWVPLEIINQVTELDCNNDCCIYMFEIDGVISTTWEEIDKWIARECWKHYEHAPQ